MNTTRIAFAAVRCAVDTREEYIDTGSINPLPEMVTAYCNEVADRIPSWARANPVIRVARVEIREI